jgi:hypothetical protein
MEQQRVDELAFGGARHDDFVMAYEKSKQEMYKIMTRELGWPPEKWEVVETLVRNPCTE